MIRKKILNLSMIGLVILILTSTFGALAAANSVPVSYAMDTTFPIDQNQFIPQQCRGIIFDDIIYGAGDINGGPRNDLIFGSSGNDNIRGGNGDDCIIGGGGDDYIRGQNGDDFLDGGPGNDRLEGGPGNDTCINGEDLTNCEVVN